MRIVYWVNLKFKVPNLIDASVDTHIVTNTNVCQLDAFCDRLKFCSTSALDCRTGQNKGRYCEKELLFLLISLLPDVFLTFLKIEYL